MVTTTLSVGDHTIKWTLQDYYTLIVKVKVAADGTLTCSQLNGKAFDCSASGTPRVVISGNVITGYLRPITPAATSSYTAWVTGCGGNDSIGAAEVLELFSGYLGLRTLGFTATSANVLDAYSKYVSKYLV